MNMRYLARTAPGVEDGSEEGVVVHLFALFEA